MLILIALYIEHVVSKGNYMKGEERYRKQINHVFSTIELESGRVARHRFVQFCPGDEEEEDSECNRHFFPQN